MTNSITSYIFTFSLGIAAGAAIAWKFAKAKYEEIANQEIDEIREMYRKKMGETSDEKNEEKTEPVSDEERDEYASILHENGYVQEGGIKPMVNERPYVITPEEFGETDFETVSLTYFADGVLTDEQDEPIEDVDSLVGEDALTHFGEYEDDSVFVRNEEKRTDYEILLDVRNYADLYNNESIYPHPTED